MRWSNTTACNVCPQMLGDHLGSASYYAQCLRTGLVPPVPPGELLGLISARPLCFLAAQMLSLDPSLHIPASWAPLPNSMDLPEKVF